MSQSKKSWKRLVPILMVLSLALISGCSSQRQPLEGKESSIKESQLEVSYGQESQEEETASSQEEALQDGDTFAQIRAQIPYEGVQYTVVGQYPTELDETGKKMTEYLSSLRLKGEDFNNVDELDKSWSMLAIYYATKSYGKDVDSSPEVVKLLQPIADSVSKKLNFPEGMFWLKEHLDKTAQILYGETYEIDYAQDKTSKFKYMEEEGVVTPPHMGGGMPICVYVLSYKDEGNQYRVEAVFDGGGYDIDTEELIPEKTWKEYLTTKAQKREIILSKTKDGGFLIKSCHKK